jgi:hypothetical protein
VVKSGTANTQAEADAASDRAIKELETAEDENDE